MHSCTHTDILGDEWYWWKTSEAPAKVTALNTHKKQLKNDSKANSKASSNSETVPKFRILCLHGYLQNEEAFRHRTGSLRKALKSKAEFIFVDAPVTAVPLAADDEQACGGDSTVGVGLRGWWVAGENNDEALAKNEGAQGVSPRVRPSQSKQAIGWDTSSEFLSQVSDTLGPFDGVLGFSQGASVAALLLAQNRLPTVKFAILISGFLPVDAELRKFVTHPGAIRIPSLHVIGENDTLVPRDRTQELENIFECPCVFAHDGRHMVPSNAEFRNIVKRFVEQIR
ncbi:hypothetical protein CYMTET_13886 [Cymbomonas tetramitiformis]|uniref:Serine hydrolase domain-containing protein n=1 Tax=Cymbomonas tetramitiformis TaxID=36881 RepID=A0AAE0GH61_9CHLO|nr:hypothetical protein CYMTET_13886 [Cymbomonas tetramitiformis]